MIWIIIFTLFFLVAIVFIIEMRKITELENKFSKMNNKISGYESNLNTAIEMINDLKKQPLPIVNDEKGKRKGKGKGKFDTINGGSFNE